MDTSFCSNLHEVWWGWLNGERVPFVRVTYGYELLRPNGQARPLRQCFRRHAEVCDSTCFTPPRPSSTPFIVVHPHENLAGSC